MLHFLDSVKSFKAAGGYQSLVLCESRVTVNQAWDVGVCLWIPVKLKQTWTIQLLYENIGRGCWDIPRFLCVLYRASSSFTCVLCIPKKGYISSIHGLVDLSNSHFGTERVYITRSNECARINQNVNQLFIIYTSLTVIHHHFTAEHNIAINAISTKCKFILFQIKCQSIPTNFN